MSEAGTTAASPAGNIETVLALTPVQEGMLFHCLEAGREGLYVEQYTGLLSGPLRPEDLRAAWDQTLAAHQAMRALFVWDRAERPVQIIRRQVRMPWRYLDWSGMPEAERAARFETLLSGDRSQGFTLDQAPLMRVTLIRLTPRSHRLLWTNHHLLMDGWSTPRVLGEVLERCYALSAGRTFQCSVSPPLAPYLDWVLSQDLRAAETFWTDTLQGFREPNALPLNDGRRPSAAESHGQARLALSAHETAALQDWARRNRLTMSTLFHAAWGLLVGVYSQCSDVIIGMTVSGRSGGPEGIDRVVGLFLNTLPLRLTLNPNERVLDWLRQVQERQLAALEHEQTPLPAIQRWSDTAGSGGLFETLAAFENYPDSGHELTTEGELHLEGIEYREHTNYPISAIAVPGAELNLLIVHDRSRLEDDAAQRMVRQLGEILSQLAAKAEEPLSAVDPVAAGERSHLLALSGSPRPAASDRGDVVERIRRSAARRPGESAVVCGSDRLDYRGLMDGAQALARRLQADDIGPGNYVGICLERGVELPMAALAVLMSGAAYVPLDPEYPEDRLALVQSVLRRANAGRAPLIVRGGAFGGGRRETGPVFDLDSLPSRTAPNQSLVKCAAEDPAYVIFTSGSTGAPKGVVVTRGNLAASTEARFGYYADSAPSCFLLVSSFAFDSAVAGLYWTLVAGGRLVLLPPRAAPDVALLAELIENEQVSHTLMLPSLYRLLLENADPRQLRSLETVIVAGEACPAELVALHRRHLPDAALHNEYGPTEATVWCTAERVDRSDPDSAPGIGRAVPGARIYVLDQARRLLPLGVHGEIAIAGDGVAAGYLGSPDQTDDRFVREPFPPHARMYMSGDLGRIENEGRIRFLGRMDEQLKVRGNRVEPTEIESLLRCREDIADAAVVLADGSRLVGFLVAAQPRPLDTAAIGGWLGQQLPRFMVPGGWHTLDRLPSTVTGKLDRRALTLEAERQRPKIAVPTHRPRSAAEQVMSEVIASVLGLDQVGTEDNFFELGGDSIKSIQVAAEARRRGLRISAHDLFRHQTATALATAASALSGASSAAAERPALGPLTPIQRWFREQTLIEPGHWNQSFMIGLNPALKRPAIEAALQALAARHDALRMRLRNDGDEQRLTEVVSPKVLEFDFEAIEAQLRTSAEDEAIRVLQTQLNPARGIVLGAAAFELGSPQARLLLSVHHLCVDVLSWPLLLHDLEQLLQDPRAAENLPVPGSYLAWANALVGEASSPQTAGEFDYWLGQSTVTDTDLPTDFSDGDDDEDSSRAVSIRITTAQAPSLNTRDGSRAIVLLGALTHTLVEWRGTTALNILMEGHGREPMDDAPAADSTVGWFTSLFPIRIDVERQDHSATHTLERVQAAWRRVPRGGLGYGLLRYLSPDPRIRSRLADCGLPPVLFNYLGWVGDDEPLGHMIGAVRHCPVAERDGRNRRPHPLEVSAWSEPGAVRIDWRYSANRYQSATIERLAEQMRRTLQALDVADDEPETSMGPDLGEDLDLSGQDLDALLTQLPD